MISLNETKHLWQPEDEIKPACCWNVCLLNDSIQHRMPERDAKSTKNEKTRSVLPFSEDE
jgi:hypothetical protein